MVTEHEVLPDPANLYVKLFGGGQRHWINVVLDVIPYFNSLDLAQ